MADGFEDRAARARHLGVRARESVSEGAIENALRLEQQATELWRSLADEKPERFSIDLAKSLTSLANRFSQLHRLDGALKATNEGVGLWRQLSATAPHECEPDLAYALSAWCKFQLSATKRPFEVYSTSSETVQIWRRLCEREPKAYRLPFANSLLFHYRMGDPTGRRKTELLEEAICLWRGLAAEEFSKHGFQLVICLDSLAFELGASPPGTARWKASLAARREAKRTRRRLYASRLRGWLLRPLRGARTQGRRPTG